MLGVVVTTPQWWPGRRNCQSEGSPVSGFSRLRGSPEVSSNAQGSAMTEEQQAYIQGLVTDLQVPFDAAVQKRRNLKPAQMEAIKSGRIFLTAEALKLRLIDGIQPRSVTLSQLMKAR